MIRSAFLILAIAVWVTEGAAQEYGSSPIRLGQGEVITIPYEATQATEVRGRFYDRPVAFYPGGEPGRWRALLGVDLDDPFGPAELTIELWETRDLTIVRLPVEVKAARFGTQALTLPKAMVDLDAKTLARVNAEQARVTSLLEAVSPERLWRGPFLLPVEGQIAGSFGMRRVMNGQPRSPHSGEDIIAPRGTPVRAANNAVVRLVDDLFFSGKSVILDHGLGLFTLYFHLSESSAREGGTVTRGEVIGTVGASGRVTGPHLHWGVVLGGARVNPRGLLALPRE